MSEIATISVRRFGGFPRDCPATGHYWRFRNLWVASYTVYWVLVGGRPANSFRKALAARRWAIRQGYSVVVEPRRPAGRDIKRRPRFG